EVTAQDYVEIVERLCREFKAGVQKNLRVRIASNLWQNLLMLVTRRRTRTERLAWLYERHLYSRVEDGKAQDEHRRWRRRRMTDLLVHPKDERSDFSPVRDNW